MGTGPFQDQAAARSWLLEEWTAQFAAAMDSMTGHTAGLARTATPVPTDCSWYQQEFSLEGAFLLTGASGGDWLRLGAAALEGAGLTEVSNDDALGTCLELLAQATSGLAQLIGRKIDQEITAQPPRDAGEIPPAREAAAYTFDLGSKGPITLFVASSAVLCAALIPPAEPAAPSVPLAEHPSGQTVAVHQSRTLDLLMEVELPVSISFGRASLPLREVLKLNSGSIVELNRTISEPVEVIVNNCVIARGEVVVVDGNYGIRIQQVVSREERLRSLN